MLHENILRCYVGTKLYIKSDSTQLIHKQHEAGDSSYEESRRLLFYAPIRRLPLRSYIRT